MGGAAPGRHRGRIAEHIYSKLNVNDRAAAIATAFERGLPPTNRGT